MLRNMPPGYGFFSYDARGGGSFPLDRFERVLRASKAQADEIHGVVLPELAVTDTDLPEIWKRLAAAFPGAFLIAGTGAAPVKKEFYSKNEVACWFGSPRKGVPLPISQKKHHRWLLDSSQLQQYGLTPRLGGQLLWENIGLGARELKFFPLTGSLTLCFLICEDLARPDPIGDLIRAVGPNLVIALLMDGPQLTHRWAARYAAALADDPGSSVLSLTSIGMARLSTPLGKPESRVVALWKDASRGPFEIELPQDADALVLNLSLDQTEEWSADGRSDGGAAGRWVLQTVSPISVLRDGS